MYVYLTGLSARVHMHGTTESKAMSSLLGFMYFADISIVNSGVCEAYAHVFHLVLILYCKHSFMHSYFMMNYSGDDGPSV